MADNPLSLCRRIPREGFCPSQAIRFMAATLLAVLIAESQLFAQSVGLPTPRLLTTMPMGGQVGTQVEVVITGENIDDADVLLFSDSRITAVPQRDATGKLDAAKYLVTIPATCPPGIYEARVITRLGISSSRIFSVGTLPEVVRKTPNTSLATAMELPVNSICNAVMSPRSIDHFAFPAKQGQRFLIECAAKGIDSKLDAVLIVADSTGRDLLVERLGNVIDFTAPADGKYLIKVHELTFKGSPGHFYRLVLQELPVGSPIARQSATRPVNSFSWPPVGLREVAESSEHEPNNGPTQSQRITLPCDIAGSFFPAADVDTFEFDAKKGDVWWVEVASERLGLPTDPSILVQHVQGRGADEKLTDVAEFSDIPSPVKVSSNGYAYDGPPYDAGSADILGRLVIREDGIHRLQISDLFGGTRNDPRNVYRLVIRKAAPDFALVAWGFHMELRNGDRNALSKPLALRGGATMALEVVVVRRDGFDGDIELVMDDLPEGVTARGLKIPAGKSRGIMLISASQNAPRAVANVKFFGRSLIDGTLVTRPCWLASMAWPVTDAWSEIPRPRLLADVPVSVSGFEFAPLSLSPHEPSVREVTVGEKLIIPLMHTRRSEFSGTTLKLKVFGTGFDQAPAFEIPLTSDTSEAVFDLAALKTPPGEYLIGFYGGAVAKYRHQPEAIPVAEEQLQSAKQEQLSAETEAKQLAEDLKSASVEQKTQIEKSLAEVIARQKIATTAVTAATDRLKKVTDVAKPRDIVDIVVSEPIAIRVKPAEHK